MRIDGDETIFPKLIWNARYLSRKRVSHMGYADRNFRYDVIRHQKYQNAFLDKAEEYAIKLDAKFRNMPSRKEKEALFKDTYIKLSYHLDELVRERIDFIASGQLGDDVSPMECRVNPFKSGVNFNL